MGLDTHIQNLSDKHRRLEESIAEALAHPAHNDIEITSLKRQKLRIKEELERLRHETTH